jgi:HEAT repeat protein
MPRTLLVCLVVVACLVLVPSGRTGKKEEPKAAGRTAKEWLELFQKSKDPKQKKIRQTALTALSILARKSDPKVIPGLIEVVRTTPEAVLREEAIQTLGDLKADAKAAVSTLIELLQTEKEKEAPVREAAAVALGRIGPDAKSAVNPLATTMRKDPSAKVREAAARALGRLVPYSKTRSVELGEALKDPQPEVGEAAAEALKDLGPDAVAARDHLIGAVKDSKAPRFTRIYAAHALSRLGGEDTSAVPVLAAVLVEKGEKSDPKVREAMAEALGRFGSAAEAAVTQLGQALSDPQEDVRRAVIAALVKVGPKAKAIWSDVKKALTDKDKFVRNQAVYVAASFATEVSEVIPELVQRCRKDDVVEVRLAAVQALSDLGAAAKSAVKDLEAISRDDSQPRVREAAAAAVKKING